MSLNHSFYHTAQVINDVHYGDKKEEIKFLHRMWITPTVFWTLAIILHIILVCSHFSSLSVLHLLVLIYSFLSYSLWMGHIYYCIKVETLDIRLEVDKNDEDHKGVVRNRYSLDDIAPSSSDISSKLFMSKQTFIKNF